MNTKLTSHKKMAARLEQAKTIIQTLRSNKGSTDSQLDDLEEIINEVMEAELAEERVSLAKKVEERTAELSLANAELARAARLKDEFLAHMSYELRTPLNAIFSMSELLIDGIYGEINENQLKAVGHIENGGRHLLSLINDILDLSKIEAGNMKLEPENIIIEDVCHSCIQMVKQIAIKKQVKVLFSSDENVKTLFADERAVKQILVNLLDNAIKFTSSKGKVTLELLGDEINHVVNINVIDTGIGIPKHELDNIFKPFVSIYSSFSRQHEGTGLGLAFVYKLVELHGASIRAKSEVGKGSTFTVSLPWQDRSKVLAQSEDDYIITQKVRHAGAVVLVAEDNETNIIAIQRGLTQYGYKVIVARDGIEAIERAHETLPAIILMDIQMPGMDGLEATKQIRADTDEQLAKTPIIAMTALAMPSDKERFFDAGTNAYFSKPVKIKQLVEEIERQLL
jgi:signal transduction histidine kinase/CheY-like chemotaxis protein